MQPDSSQITALRTLLDRSRRAVIFTGAGISTESGIPDFRSPGGVWTQMQPIYFQEYVASEEKRREAWRRRFSNVDNWVGAQPNCGHHAVAQLVNSGKASSIITQNVDNLHQASGVQEEKVIELHGNATYATCLSCGVRIELDVLQRQFDAAGTVEPCRDCGGIIKPATISFGQQMPEQPMRRAYAETMRCDLFIVLGSSLSVFPAAGFPLQAKQNGASLVIVNRDPTPLDETADLVLHSGIGNTLANVLGFEDS